MTTMERDIIRTPTIPQDRAHGPVTAARLRRTAIIYGLLCVAGMLPVLFGASAGWQAFGLGLWLPGGGFVADGGWAILLFPVALALFAVSVVAWFWAGMVIAPIFVWVGAALLAAGLAGPGIWSAAPFLVPLCAAGFIGQHEYKTRQRRAANLESYKVRQAYLPAALAEVNARVINEPAPGSRELTPDQLAHARLVYDLALQPIDQFKGFDTIDQFQPAAFRYQINHAAFSLGMIQGHYTPSFQGYLRKAQTNLIEKYLQRRVWGYWVLESMWGHLNFTNFNPAAKDNIMLTGWFGMHLGQYMINSGDRTYMQPDSLVFRLNEKTAYKHNFESIVKSVSDNFARSDFTLYPCEPNWIYPICNHYGMAALTSFDAVNGSNNVAKILPKWLQMLDSEFTQESGTMVGLRSYWTGIEFPYYKGEPGFAFFANVFIPERARRMWAIARTEISTCLTTDAEGKQRITLPKLQGIDAIDPGHYRPGLVFAYAAVMICAREFGDTELAEAAERSLEQDCGPVIENGVKRYKKGSRLASMWVTEAKLMGTGDFRNSFIKGPPKSVFTGPYLAEAAYPDVLVAKAFSRGDDLELVFYPGAGDGAKPIRIERLKPNAAYAVAGDWQGGQITADANGAADLTVQLAGRTALHLTPV